MKEAVIGAMITLYGVYFVCSLIWKGLKKGTKAMVNKTKEINDTGILYHSRIKYRHRAIATNKRHIWEARANIINKL